MSGICYLIISMVNTILWVLQLAMFLRVIMSWIPDMEESKFSNFLYTVTEPVVLPVRILFEKFNWFQNTPLDVAFFFAYIFLFILAYILALVA